MAPLMTCYLSQHKGAYLFLLWLVVSVMKRDRPTLLTNAGFVVLQLYLFA